MNKMTELSDNSHSQYERSKLMGKMTRVTFTRDPSGSSKSSFTNRICGHKQTLKI